jgi:ATP-dependent Zn protease
MIMHKAERKATAYHEAGHTVMGYILGRPPLSVDIMRDANGNAGHTHFPEDVPECIRSRFDDSPQKRQYLELRVLTTLAGTAAHNILQPNRTPDSGDQMDENQAREIVRDHMSWSDDHDVYIHQLKTMAQKILSENRGAVEAIAAALLERDRLTNDEITAIIVRNPPRQS